MTNVLIRTKQKNISHKMDTKLGPSDYCWWTVGALPTKDIKKVLFTDGKKVIAEGEAMGVDRAKKAIVFHPLKKVSYPLPKKAPVRGYTYVEDA